MKFRIQNREIGINNPAFIIAEIGINHNGSLISCKKMIKAAANSGADAVKIQTVEISKSYDKKTNSYKIFKGKNFSDNELKILQKYSNQLNIIFFSTPGDIHSLKRLLRLRFPVIKVSSGLADNYPLIREIIKKKIPLIISTGLSNSKDLKYLQRFIAKYKFKKIGILKCTSIYPAKNNQLGLEFIEDLKKIFKLPIGYSDHSLGDLACITAVARGAKIIEKHFTLNKRIKGGDHHISLEPKEFKKMVKKIRSVEEILGKYSFKTDKKISKNRGLFQRYLVALKNIQKGEKFSLLNVGFKRKNIKFKGLKPKYFFKLENKKSKNFIAKDQFLKSYK